MPGRFRNLEFESRRRKSEAELELPTALPSAHDRLKSADAEYRWGRFEPALRLYTRALQEDPALIPAWVGQVQMLVQLGEAHEARVWAHKALELFRNNGELLAARAQACARLNDLAGALESSDAAMQAPGRSPWRWAARGEVLIARRQRFADECFEKALAEPEAGWFERVVIGRICLHYNRLTAALQFLKQAVDLEPGHGYAWFELGQAQAALGLAPAAAVSYRRCLDCRMDFEPATGALAALATGSSLMTWLGGLWRRRR